MAVARQFIKDNLDASKQIADETIEALTLLSSLADSKAEIFKQKLEQDLLRGKTTDDLTVSITKVLNKYSETRVKTAESTVATDIVDTFKTMFDGDKKIADSICSIVEDSINAITGVSEGEESEKMGYYVLVEYPAIVRYDYYFWNRKVKAESIMKTFQDVMSVVVYKSAVDVKKLTFNEFLAVYGPIMQHASDGDKGTILAYINDAKEIYLLLGGNIDNKN